MRSLTQRLGEALSDIRRVLAVGRSFEAGTISAEQASNAINRVASRQHRSASGSAAGRVAVQDVLKDDRAA